MTRTFNKKQEITEGFPRAQYGSPLPWIGALGDMSLLEQFERINKRLWELENMISREKVIVLREITREDAKREIQQLFTSGRTLYYSDIVQELKIDLETVVGICNELQESGEIDIDASIL